VTASEWREPAQSVERSDDHDIEPDTKVISSADVHGFKGTRDDQMKSKHLRLPEPTAKDFEVLCALLGISERQAGELAVRQWIQRNRSQVSLETWTEARGSIASVDRALVNVHVAIMKAELRQILDELQIVAAEYQMEVLRRLQKLMPTAHALVEETRDKELGQILTAVATRVTNAAPDPERLSPS